MFLKFYPGEKAFAERFAHSVPAYKISMARLQEHFIKRNC